MRATLRSPLVLLLAVAALSGCGTNRALTGPGAGGGATSDDQSQVASEVSQQPAIVEDGISDSQDPASYEMSGAGPGSDLTAIRPLNFWRTIRSRERSFVFTFSDTDTTGHPTKALVEIDTRLRGAFNIAVGSSGEGSPPDSVIHKRLDELRVRRVLLRRVPGAEGRRTAWRVAAVSGVEVTSRAHTTEIASLQVQSGALDVTVTDALALFRMRDVLRLEADAEVTLTLTTGRNDDVCLLHLADRRFRLRNNGDDTYTGTFRTGAFLSGMHHFGVDALSHGTLFDDALPYDSQRWVLPFVIAPEELAGPEM